MKFINIAFLLLLGCYTGQYQQNNLVGNWCNYNDKKTSFDVSIFNNKDTLFLKYTYIFDNGNGINQTQGRYSGYGLLNNINRDSIMMNIFDEYSRATSTDSVFSHVDRIQIIYSKENKTLKWKIIYYQGANYLPDNITLNKCDE